MSINTQVTFDLPIASSTQLGGVAVQSSSGLLVDSSGDLSVDNTQFLSVSQAASIYATQSAVTSDLANYVPLSGSSTITGALAVYSSTVTGAHIHNDGQYISMNSHAAGIVFPDGTVQTTAFSTQTPQFNSDNDVDTNGTDGATRTIPGNLNSYIIVPSSPQTLTMPIVFPTPSGDGQELELAIYGGPGSYTFSGLALGGVTAVSFESTFTSGTNLAGKFLYVDIHQTWYQVS
jgi:hypothetical protein